MHENNPLVRLENVQMHFEVRKGLFRTEAVRAVDGVDLSLTSGEVVAVVGESGSGKTTLGRLSAGLLKPTAGHVFFQGKEIANFSKEEEKNYRRHVQIIFQDPFATIDPYMTIYDSVAEPLVIHGIGTEAERRKRVYQALSHVHLTPTDEMGDRYPHLISGGQRQRAGIARALILQPDYIVADEPVSMVDASVRMELISLLRDLRDRFGIAFLYITHDIATARHFAHRIVVMYQGRIVESGPAAVIVENPLHPYTQALIVAVPEPDPTNRLRERPVLQGTPPTPIYDSSTQSISIEPHSQNGDQKEQGNNAIPQLVEVEPEHFVTCFLKAA